MTGFFRSTIGRIFAKIVLVVCSVVAALIVVELGSRILGLRPYPVRGLHTFLRYDPNLGWSHIPKAHGTVESTDYSIEAVINGHGLRDREYSYSRVPGKKRVLVLGDSFVWGLGVGLDQTFSKRLEALLTDTEVINAGVPGYSTDQELLWLERQGTKYKPDLVIVMIYWDDLAQNTSDLAHSFFYKPRFQPQPDGSQVLTGVPCPDPSVWRVGAKALTLVSGIVHSVVARRRGNPDPVRARQQIRLTASLVNRMKRVCEGVDARFMVATICSGRRACTRLADVLKSDNISVCSLDKTMGLVRRGMTISKHDGHWNASGHEHVARYLMGYISRYGLLDSRETTGRGQVGRMKDPLTEGTDINGRDNEGRTALTVAASQGRAKPAAILLENGADVNSRDSYGWTPCLWATVRYHPEMVRMLVDHASRLEVTDRRGWTPLIWAAVQGSGQIVKTLVDSGADVSRTDVLGNSAIVYAAAQGDPGVVRILLDKGCSLDSRDKDGCPALVLAALKGHPEVVELLLARGASLEAQDDNGRTALSVAASSGHFEVVKQLLQRKAMLNSSDKYGKKPLTLVKEAGDREMEALLLKHGARE